MTPQQMRERIEELEERVAYLEEQLLPGEDRPIFGCTGRQSQLLRALARVGEHGMTVERLLIAVYGADRSCEVTHRNIHVFVHYLRKNPAAPWVFSKGRGNNTDAYYWLSNKDCGRVLQACQRS